MSALRRRADADARVMFWAAMARGEPHRLALELGELEAAASAAAAEADGSARADVAEAAQRLSAARAELTNVLWRVMQIEGLHRFAETPTTQNGKPT